MGLLNATVHFGYCDLRSSLAAGEQKTEGRLGIRNLTARLVLATKRHSGHVAGTSAYPPTGNIRWPMSVFVPISSALVLEAAICDLDINPQLLRFSGLSGCRWAPYPCTAE